MQQSSTAQQITMPLWRSRARTKSVGICEHSVCEAPAQKWHVREPGGSAPASAKQFRSNAVAGHCVCRSDHLCTRTEQSLCMSRAEQIAQILRALCAVSTQRSQRSKCQAAQKLQRMIAVFKHQAAPPQRLCSKWVNTSACVAFSSAKWLRKSAKWL